MASSTGDGDFSGSVDSGGGGGGGDGMIGESGDSEEKRLVVGTSKMEVEPERVGDTVAVRGEVVFNVN